MSKGARAIVVAAAFPEGEQGRGKNESARKAQKIGGFSVEMLRMARLVLRVTPTVASAVKAGEKPLAVAYEEAKAIEAENAERNKKLDRLKASAQDLALRVTDENMDVDEAIAALDLREAKAREEAERARTEARGRSPSNAKFGAWWDAQGFGLNRDDREALVDMGSDIEAARACLASTERRSIRHIRRKEFQQFRHVTEPATDPAAPSSPAPSPAKPTSPAKESPKMDRARQAVRGKVEEGKPVNALPESPEAARPCAKKGGRARYAGEATKRTSGPFLG